MHCLKLDFCLNPSKHYVNGSYLHLHYIPAISGMYSCTYKILFPNLIRRSSDLKAHFQSVGNVLSGPLLISCTCRRCLLACQPTDRNIVINDTRFVPRTYAINIVHSTATRSCTLKGLVCNPSLDPDLRNTAIANIVRSRITLFGSARQEMRRSIKVA